MIYVSASAQPHSPSSSLHEDFSASGLLTLGWIISLWWGLPVQMRLIAFLASAHWKPVACPSSWQHTLSPDVSPGRVRGQRYPWLRITGFQPPLLSHEGLPLSDSSSHKPQSHAWLLLVSHPHVQSLTSCPSDIHSLSSMGTPATTLLFHQPPTALPNSILPTPIYSQQSMFSDHCSEGVSLQLKTPLWLPSFPQTKTTSIWRVVRPPSTHSPISSGPLGRRPSFLIVHHTPHPSICPGYTGFLPSFPKYQMYSSVWAAISTIPQS